MRRFLNTLKDLIHPKGELMRRRTRFSTVLALLLIAVLLNAATPGLAQEGVCDTAPETRLAIGRWASVTNVVTTTALGGLRLRAEPRTSGANVEVLPAGTLLRVIDGPACNDGFHWWYVRVEASGVEGWAAEAFPGSYYLAPALAPTATMIPIFPPATATSPSPQALFPTNTPRPSAGVTPATPTALAAACPADLPFSYLAPGVTVYAADDRHPARLRLGPSVSSNFHIQLIYPEMPLQIVGEPICADGLRWWMVQTETGQAFYTVEEANGRYLLVTPGNLPPTPVLGVTPTVVPTALPLDLPATPRPSMPPDVLKHAAYVGDALAVGANDGVHLYDAAALNLRGIQATGPALDFVTIGSDLYAVTWASEGIRLVSVPGGQTRTTLLNAPYDPAWAAAAPDGEWLILGPTSDGAPATLWDLRSGTPPVAPPYWWPLGGQVRHAAFTPNGRYVLLDDIFYDRSCQVLGRGCAFDLIRQDYLASGAFSSVDWAADGRTMIGFSSRLWLWDGDALAVGFTLQSTLGAQDPRRAAISPDATRAAVAAGALMELWNLQSYYTPGVITLPGAVRSLDFRPDGTQVAVAAGESVVVYDAASGNVVRQVE